MKKDAIKKGKVKTFEHLFVRDDSGDRFVPDSTYSADDGNDGVPAGSVPQAHLPSPTISMSIFSPSGLSLALQQNLDNQADGNSVAGAAIGGVEGGELQLPNHREDDIDSRSGSDNPDGLSGDDPDQENTRKKKRYHRHTPQQIQELEALFKECPHPDEKQRLELSRRLCLESRQVKFWFQNRRTQMKTQMERHENTILKQENDNLLAENISMREALRNPLCSNCGGPEVLGDNSLEEQHLRFENARLKSELERVCSIAARLTGKPINTSFDSPVPLPLPDSSLELAVGNNAFGGHGPLPDANLPPAADFVPTGLSSSLGTMGTQGMAIVPAGPIGGGVDPQQERFILLELALNAMDELVKVSQIEEPLWNHRLDGSLALNYEEYSSRFPRCISQKPIGFVSVATRETGMVFISGLALVETLMDASRWAEMFPSIIAKTTAFEVISGGTAETRDDALQLMNVELQVLTPLVPIFHATFLRFCKQLAEGVWAIVDVSIDDIRDNAAVLPGDIKIRRLPSGCLVQDMFNGYSKVTWVEHVEYNEAAIHPMCRPLFQSGMALGALRWIASLQRQCQSFAILMASSLPPGDNNAVTPSGRRSMVKLAQRMTDNFCAGVCASSVREWNRLDGHVRIIEDVRVMTRQSVADPGEPPGVVISAATSVWLPVSPSYLFRFLCNENFRIKWDILSTDGPMQEMIHIPKGQDSGNAVSLLRASAASSNQCGMLILQETCTDASGSLMVYAPVDVSAMHLVMSGGDSAYVALLPSGFAILPDGQSSTTTAAHGGAAAADGEPPAGSLLTVAFQILVSNHPGNKLTLESAETVNTLITGTVQNIRAALNSET